MLCWAVTFTAVCFAWIFFRAANLPTALSIVSRITQLNAAGVQWIYSPLLMLLPLVVLGHYLGWRIGRCAVAEPGKMLQGRSVFEHLIFIQAVRPHAAAGVYAVVRFRTFGGAFLMAAWVLVLLLFSAQDSSPFIYFQF